MCHSFNFGSYFFEFWILTAIVGDITPSDGVPKEEKSRRERAALNDMCRVLGGGMRGIHLCLASVSIVKCRIPGLIPILSLIVPSILSLN